MGQTVKIGDGATISVGSDSYPATVIKVTPKSITVQEDYATCISGNSHNSEDQRWQITRDLSGRITTARWSEKRQRYQSHGTPVYVGHRRRYNDPCF
jgi:hypothetical protein